MRRHRRREEVKGTMEHLCKEMGRTVRYAMTRTDRTVRLIAISTVGAILIALFYLLMHQMG